LKYNVVEWFSFYERAEVKDLLSYLKLCLNPNDSVSLLRAIQHAAAWHRKTSLDSLNSKPVSRACLFGKHWNASLKREASQPEL
jgi:DNA helicase-2/ATP-dependent DNA helicase PcrA